MSATVTAIVGVGLVSAYMSKESAKDASDTAAEGTEKSVAGQTASLDYLKEVERVPRQYRESAMSMLAAEFGIPAAQEFQQAVAPSAPGTSATPSNQGIPPALIGYDNQGQGTRPATGAPGGHVSPSGGYNTPGDRGEPGYNKQGDYGYYVARDTGEGGTYNEWVKSIDPNADSQPTPRPDPGAAFLTDQRNQGNTKLVNDPGLTGFNDDQYNIPVRTEKTPDFESDYYQQANAQAAFDTAASQVAPPPQGVPGAPTAPAAPMSITDRAMASPLYQSLMDTIDASRVDLTGDSIRREGEEAVLRNQSMTGGFRSGNTQSNLARFNMGLEERLVGARNEQDRRVTADKSNALLTAYNQQISGLQGFANLPSNANAIAGLQTGIGDTQAAGAIARGQIQQAGDQAVGDAITGGVGNYLDYRAAQNASQNTI